MTNNSSNNNHADFSIAARMASDQTLSTRIKERARIIAYYLAGAYTVTEISLITGKSRPTIYRWIERYKSDGINSLITDFPRSGRPPSKTIKNINRYNILTKRELEILQLASIGKTSWEIGAILDISERTVDAHFDSIKERLKVDNRPAAIAKALRQGLME